ncbi:methionine--tRNA ligase [Malassezia sp. CBS 17886]|nr:methionine--tRNA ligase [Malassezia sp. CBS 17886]
MARSAGSALRARAAPLVPRLCRRALTVTASAAPKPYYATTPIFYVNAAPHIGHLHSGVLADVLCRYQQMRTRGWSPRGAIPDTGEARAELLTGTDEHGMKIQRAADACGDAPRALCDRVSERFRALARAGHMDYARFIRTTDDDHRVAVEALWKTLLDRGHIYMGEHEGWYAVSDEAFYPATQVRTVTDPQTGEEVQEAVESGQRVEWTHEVNYKFRLSSFQAPLVAWLKANPDAVQPRAMYDRVLSDVKAGLSDLSISRPRSRLHWGIPVPGDDAHTIYVWVDALTNYLTAARYPGDAPAWPADVHVVGKDIVRFHAVYWPALLMAAGLPLPATVLAHSHWTVERAKMSKSRGNSVNPFDVLDTYGADATRYFLMRAGGNMGADADYSDALLTEFVRKDLQGQLGNLLSRVLAPKIQARLQEVAADASCDTHTPHPCLRQPAATSADAPLLDALAALPARFDGHMARFELSRAAASVMEAVARANESVQAAEPWRATTPPHDVHRAVYGAVETLRVAGTLLQPIMPAAMGTLLDTLQVPHSAREWAATTQLRTHIPLRTARSKIPPLFPRVG